MGLEELFFAFLHSLVTILPLIAPLGKFNVFGQFAGLCRLSCSQQSSVKRGGKYDDVEIYRFLGAAVMAVIVNTIYGFDAPILRMSLFSTPMLVLLFVLVFPTTISYLLLPLGLKYLKTTLVAIYGYLILIVATVISFILGQDRFSWTQLAAIVLICASVYLVEVAESKSEKQIISKSR